MRAVEAIFFDFDNTLADDDASQRLAVARAARQVCAAMSGLAADALASTYLGVSGYFWQKTAYVSDIASTRLQLWRQALSTHGCDDDAIAADVCEVYVKERMHVCSLYDETHEVISRLSRDYRLAIITNGGSEQQLGRLRAAGLDDYFDLLVGADGGAGKPEVAIFQEALQRLGLDPARVWHAGDRLDADVLGANNAGLISVWLNRSGARRRPQDPAPAYEVETLADLEKLL
jgi:putative hydrolase of the HAD superfamily